MATNAADDRLETASTIVSPIGEQEKDLEAGSKTSVDLEERATPDPDIVNWDGPDDPANPQNWSRGRKVVTVVIVSSITFVTYAPLE